MKKVMAILFAAIMLCSFFAVSASAVANVVDYEYFVELEQYSDGYVFITYDFPERPVLSSNPYGTDLLWVDIYVFEAGTEPVTGQALFDVILTGTGVDEAQLEIIKAAKLKKTETDDQFLPTERWIGPVFDDAESVFMFETGKTYNIYFCCCNGAEWYYYGTPYTFEFTESAYGGESTTPTEAPTEAPTEPVVEVTDASTAPADDVTEGPTTGDGDVQAPANSGWILWVAIGAVVVIVIVVVVIAASKKKKAE